MSLSIKTVLINLVLHWSYLNNIFNIYIQVPNRAKLPIPIYYFSFTLICSCRNKLYWAIHLWESHNIWSYVQWINIPIHTMSIQKQYFIVVQFYNVCLTREKLTSINNTNSLPPSDYLSIDSNHSIAWSPGDSSWEWVALAHFSFRWFLLAQGSFIWFNQGKITTHASSALTILITICILYLLQLALKLIRSRYDDEMIQDH